jgi:ATP-dependent RNA helicase RhlE
MYFNQLGLNPNILKAIEAKGFQIPTEIQQKAIPFILDKKDVLASAQTGTGKTAAFVLPLLNNLIIKKNQGKRVPQILIVTPTRELAAQILEETHSYSQFTDIKSCVIFGGVKQGSQVENLKRGVDIVIATPGRLLDLVQQRLLDLQHIDKLVLDEADKMLDMGFLKDIKKIVALVTPQRQTLLFSATFSSEIKKLAHTFLKNPKIVEATPNTTTAVTVEHSYYRLDKDKKTDALIHLIKENNWHQVLIFTRTKHGANRLSQKLNKAYITATAIHGNKSQPQRIKALEDFKSKEVSVMVATDIAARGLDIPLLPYVINFELPNIAEDYVHRIGRTGRAGSTGNAISLVSEDELTYLRNIEKCIDKSIPSQTLALFIPTKGPVPGGKKRMKNENARY